MKRESTRGKNIPFPVLFSCKSGTGRAEMKSKKVVLIISILFMVVNLTSFSLIKVSMDPYYLDIDVSKPVTSEITITNSTDKFVRYRLSFKKPEGLGDKYYIGEEMQLYPRVISLPPNDSKKVRVRLKKVISSQGREFIAMINFEELKGEDEMPTVISEDSTVQMSANISVDMNYYIYGVPEKPVQKVVIKDMEVKNISDKNGSKKVISLKALNNGEAVFRGQPRITVTGSRNTMKKQKFEDLFQGLEREFHLNINDMKSGSTLRVEIVDRMDPEKVLFEESIQI